MLGRRSKLKYKAVSSQVDEANDFETRKRGFATSMCLRSSLFTSALIITYYIPSIGLTFYQHWLYERFHFPLFTVLVHLIIKYILAVIIRFFLAQKQGQKRIVLGWKEYIISLGPAGLCSGIDVGFSNWGLELITISLYTMTKSTAIVFILIFSIIFKLERKSWSLTTIVGMISVGLLLFTYKATQFNFFGFLLVLLASMSSGIRWTCVQMLMQKPKMGMKNPIDMIYHMQPWMIISVLPFAMWIEGPLVVKNCQLFRFTDNSVFLYISFKIVIGAFVAFFMEISEVLVVTYTSSLTLSIAGIFKEIFVLGLAIIWKGDQLSAINVSGLLICVCGITSHVIHKIKTAPSRLIERSYEIEAEANELGEHLIENDMQLDISSDSEGDRSDTQALFDILNKHDR